MRSELLELAFACRLVGNHSHGQMSRLLAVSPSAYLSFMRHAKLDWCIRRSTVTSVCAARTVKWLWFLHLQVQPSDTYWSMFTVVFSFTASSLESSPSPENIDFYSSKATTFSSNAAYIYRIYQTKTVDEWKRPTTS